MTPWTHVILEGYCTYDFAHEKKRSLCRLKDLDEKPRDTEWEVVDNPRFIDARKPGYCKGVPMYQCLSRGCPLFAYTNAEKKAYNKLDELYE